LSVTGQITGTAGINVPNTFGFKNRIINGAMNVWQRGTSGFITSPNYSADRWLVGASTSLSAVGQSTDVPSGYKYSLSIAGTNFPNANQRIESVNCTDLASQTVTISFWLKQSSGAGANSIGVALYYANSADNFNGGVTQIGSTTLITATSSWVQYTTTFSNISANAVNGLQLQIYANTASSATFLITGVQLEKGSTATSFDYRPYGTELALCQRYFYTCGLFNYGTNAYFQGYYGGSSALRTIPYPVTMRATPTATISQPTQVQYYSQGGVWTNTTITVGSYNAGTTDISVAISSDSTGGGKLLYLVGGATTTLPTIAVSAEL
jgi:hypothetical protein